MRVEKIFGHEASFDNNGIDSAGKKFVLTKERAKIKGTNEIVEFIDCPRKDNNTSFYYKKAYKKRKVVLHYTMGYLKGDVATLTKDKYHVSVPFVVGRNGSIYNLFSSRYWSYHLGKGTRGGNRAMSKESVGVEVSNIGPLKKVGNNLVTYYHKSSKPDIYCTLKQTEFYTKLPNEYRKYQYFATFTDEQYKTIIKLIKFLCGKYNIPKTFLGENMRYDRLSTKDFKDYSGIVSHVNCRLGKTDIGPAFDWQRVIAGVV